MPTNPELPPSFFSWEEADVSHVTLTVDPISGQQPESQQTAEAHEEAIMWMTGFAVVFHRVSYSEASSDGASDWRTELQVVAGDVLECFLDRPPQDATEMSVLNTAALTHAYLEINAGSNDFNPALLERLGFSLYDIYDALLRGVVKAHEAQGSAFNVRPPVFEALDRYLGPNSGAWEYAIKPVGNDMRARLLAAGITLPELNSQGRYDDED